MQNYSVVSTCIHKENACFRIVKEKPRSIAQSNSIAVVDSWNQFDSMILRWIIWSIYQNLDYFEVIYNASYFSKKLLKSMFNIVLILIGNRAQKNQVLSACVIVLPSNLMSHVQVELIAKIDYYSSMFKFFLI